MRIKSLKNIEPEFIDCTLEELLEKENVLFTGFYLNDGDLNKFIYKVGNQFLMVKARNINSINDRLLEKSNSNTKNRFIINEENVGHCVLSIYELVHLYEYNNNIKVFDHFRPNENSCINGTYRDFLRLVKEVISLEREIMTEMITEKYDIMKYIYDKYKMSSSYWSPEANYGMISANLRLANDKNRVVSHPYDYLGLIIEKYATCQGMAEGLVELFRYFEIDAEKANNSVHGMCKINLVDDSGVRRVSYIDLSREVTRNFRDNKYIYRDRRAIPRIESNHIAQPDSYEYFMKASVGKYIDDSDLSIAVDYDGTIQIHDDVMKLTHDPKRQPPVDMIMTHDPKRQPPVDMIMTHRTKSSSNSQNGVNTTHHRR